MSKRKPATKDRAPPRVPVNVICGTLGVGKTTAINHLLALRPANERWAVLVNEYGQIGLDQALLAGSAKAPGVEVREVAGGCICCSAGFMFQVSLILMLRTRPDRLLIEPTGLATLSGILDTLLHPGIREAVDIRSIITLVAPGAWPREGPTPQVQETIDGADVLLANRCDEATEEALLRFESLAGETYPPKTWFGRIEHGRVPVELLDRVEFRPENAIEERAARADPAEFGHHRHHSHTEAHPAPSEGEPSAGATPSTPMRRAHTSEVASTVGWVFPEDHIFDDVRVDEVLRNLMRAGMTRLKAVVHTNRGWRAYNLTETSEQVETSPYRRDSRMELIYRAEVELDPDRVEANLYGCLVSPCSGG